MAPFGALASEDATCPNQRKWRPRAWRVKVTLQGRVKRSFVARVVGRLKEGRDKRAPRLGPPPPSFWDETEHAAPPIFVVGCQRSGTSLIRRILDSHSRITCPPESHFILPMIQVLRDERALRGLSSMGYDKTTVEAVLAVFIRTFFERYAEEQGKQRWADKTPQYVACLRELQTLFGDAKFIILVRNGLDVAFSLADAHRHYPAIDEYVTASNGSVPVGAGRFWAEQNRKIEDFRKGFGESCFSLRYEDLTTHPESVLREMFSFLGEPWEADVMEYGRFSHHGGVEDPDVRRRRRIEPNSGRHRNWPPHVQEAVRHACEPMLSLLNYE